MVYTLIVTGLLAIEGAHPWGEVGEIFRCPDAWGSETDCCWCQSASVGGLFTDHARHFTIVYVCWVMVYETSSFHLLFGEMTTTIYDVACLFHLLLAGNFFITPLINQEFAWIMVEQHLGVTKSMVMEESRFNMGSPFVSPDSGDVSDTPVEHSMYEADTRVYMLHLVWYTILADRYYIYIDARYIILFSKLEHVN